MSCELHLEAEGLLANGALEVPDLLVNGFVMEHQRLLERKSLGTNWADLECRRKMTLLASDERLFCLNNYSPATMRHF